MYLPIPSTTIVNAIILVGASARPHYFKFRVVLLLGWLSAPRREFSLPFYLTLR